MSSIIDLESDTKSLPPDAMRQFMVSAQVGDEQYDEDPTTRELCRRVAELLGKEKAIYLPSGTMCNEIATGVHCRPGDELICDRTSHIVNFEVGGPAATWGVMTHMIDGKRGIFTADQARKAIRSPSHFSPRSRLLWVEQTANQGGGSIWPLKTLHEVADAAHDAGMATHMDGARLLNAVVASGVSAASYAEKFDSVWIDLSKGLAAPIGAVLCGSADFIRQARVLKQRLGGAMRQSGIIAAAGIYALDHHVNRLAEDNNNAQLLARGLATIPGITIDPDEVETNIVYFEVHAKDKPHAFQFEKSLSSKGVKAGAYGDSLVRMVTCLNVNEADINKVIEIVRDVMAES